jgi:hypothetical protein
MTVKKQNACGLLLVWVLGCTASERQVAAPESPPATPPAPSTTSAVVPEHECPCKASVMAPPEACVSSQAPAPDHTCFVFNTPKTALAQVLHYQPRILAVGETHLLEANSSVLSTTNRFRQELLPELKGFKAMLMEALIPPQGCAKEEKQVREQTAEVTKPQAPTNQNDFLALANEAKARGITPYPLRLSCEDLKSITGAGEGSVEQSLHLIALKTIVRARALVTEGRVPLLLYGGMMHNDVEPKAGQEAWSFGPELSDSSESAGYIELDLITRELIADRAPWTELDWYQEYQENCAATGTILIRRAARSFVLIFPWQHPQGAKACSKEQLKGR